SADRPRRRWLVLAALQPCGSALAVLAGAGTRPVDCSPRPPAEDGRASPAAALRDLPGRRARRYLAPIPARHRTDQPAALCRDGANRPERAAATAALGGADTAGARQRASGARANGAIGDPDRAYGDGIRASGRRTLGGDGSRRGPRAGGSRS